FHVRLTGGTRPPPGFAPMRDMPFADTLRRMVLEEARRTGMDPARPGPGLPPISAAGPVHVAVSVHPDAEPSEQASLGFQALGHLRLGTLPAGLAPVQPEIGPVLQYVRTLPR